MEVSAPDVRSHVPGFRDGLGNRHTVAQRTGGELEFLQFCQPLASAPFFAANLKSRVARLSRFTHSSYCRVRRVQYGTDGDGSLALVSSHTAGRRLAELLDVAARADLRPTTGAVLSATRQLMTAAALLHDFAPDGFHGALGPERLVLATDGRIVIAEHVLGTAVEEAARAWGVNRLWQDFRVAVLAASGSPHYGRRVDVLQIGLVALELYLGRSLEAGEYPDQLGWLLARATERKPDGSEDLLRPALRSWFERSLALQGDQSYDTLLDAQKALGQIAQSADLAGAPAEWESFVRHCETAAVRVPVVVRIPEPAEPPSSMPVEANPLEAVAQAGVEAQEPPAIANDPFGPWPVAVPAEGGATLLDTFLAATQSVESAPVAKPATVLKALPPVELPPEPRVAAPDPWAGAKEAPVRPEAALEVVGLDARPTAASTPEVRSAAPSQPLSLADWRIAEPPPSTSVTSAVDDQPLKRPAPEARPPVRRPPDSRRWVRLSILGVLTAAATLAAIYAPALWVFAYETFRTHGRVTVESNPPEAVVTVDGQVRGHTPVVLRLEPGEHVLEVQSGGSAQAKKILVQERVETTETFVLPEAGARGGFRITTYPSPGRIAIDGKYRGDAPLKITDLTPGTHTLVVETKLGTQEQDVVVQSGAVLQLEVPTASWVKVDAPFPLDVVEDGRQVGNTGSGPVLVRPGRHRLDFSNKELGLKLRQVIDAAPGQVVTVPLDLPTGMMNVYADQTADVIVDGQKVGETPLSSLQVPLGPHDVVLRHPKYGEVRYSVRVTLAAPVNLNVAFRK
jgi:hypothetical protein